VDKDQAMLVMDCCTACSRLRSAAYEIEAIRGSSFHLRVATAQAKFERERASNAMIVFMAAEEIEESRGMCENFSLALDHSVMARSWCGI